MSLSASRGPAEQIMTGLCSNAQFQLFFLFKKVQIAEDSALKVFSFSMTF